MQRARVDIFGHPGYDGRERGELIASSDVSGGMHRSDGLDEHGVCFYVTPIDYSGLPVDNPNAFPRARYQHLLILHDFDWDDRCGHYIHIPYGGSIDISAIDTEVE